MSYKIICNISDIPDHHHFCKKSDFSENETGFGDWRTQSRTYALEQLGVPKEHIATADLGVSAMGFDRYTVTDHSVVERLAQTLGLTKPSARVQILPPGGTSLLHLDDLDQGYMFPLEANLKRIQFSDQEVARFKADPRYAVRFLIMLEDHMPGQLMTFGEQVLNEWNRGDVIYWDWPTVAHSTMNTGYWARPLMRLSGLASTRTMDIIANGLV